MAGQEGLASAQFGFDGEWRPNDDPALIGAKDYSVLRNLRYIDNSIEGVQGYTKINTTALSDYPKIRNGAQLVTDRSVGSYVFTQAENAAGTGSVVYQNQTAIPSQGNFESSAIHTDATGAGLGRFSKFPGGNLGYCNGVENCVWAGDEMRVSGFMTCDDSANANPKDYSEAVNNTLTSTGNLARVSSTQKYFLVFSTRPLSGVYLGVHVANTAASTLSGKYWNGSSFAAVSSLVDGTSDGTNSLAQSGWITFSSTVSVSKPYHFQGMYLYAYQFAVTDASNTDISYATVRAPWQNVVDVWDGVFRQCVAFQASRFSVYEDYTLEVNEESSVQYPIAATCGGLTSLDHILLGFTERQSAIRFTMLAGKTNATAVTAAVYYWDGDSWVEASGFNDSTSESSKTLNQTGLMTWMPPADGVEFPQELFGITAYFYKITLSGTLTTGTEYDGTSVDMITGIPAQTTIKPFKFPAMYKSMALLCNFESGKESNRIDYSMPNAADVWNGDLSSKNGPQSLYVGNNEPIVAASQLYNRFGSNIFSTFLVIKRGETHLLNGDSPEDFRLYPISLNVGCAAPLTVATAETGFEMVQDEVVRNVAIWLSFSGPVLFDGAIIMPLKGIDKYFNPADPECVNHTYIENSRAWYDATHREYNLLIPSGNGQVTCNKWFVYDLARKRWFEKDTGEAEMPQCGFSVIDTYGTKYAYAGIDTGYMMRLENGSSWDGEEIKQVVETGDFLPMDSIWKWTLLRRIKVIAEQISEDHTLDVVHIADTEDSGYSATFVDCDGLIFEDVSGGYAWDSASFMELQLSEDSAARIVTSIVESNLLAVFHRLRFTVRTSTQARAYRPIAWGYQYREVRDDQ